MKQRVASLRSNLGMRGRLWIVLALVASGIAATLVRAQLTDEEKRKREEFLRAREEMHTITSPTPSESPSPTAKPKAARHKPKGKKGTTPKPTETPEPTRKPKAEESESVKRAESPTPTAKAKAESTKKRKKTAASEESETPKPKKTSAAAKRKNAKSDESPSPRAKLKSDEDEAKRKKGSKLSAAESPEPTPSKSAAPKSVPEPSGPPAERPSSPAPRGVPVATPSVASSPVLEEPPQVNVRKSGLEKPSGFSLPFHFFGKHYQYLSRSVRAAIDRAPVLRRRWQFIIVHNSGTRQGNARVFDYYHRHVRRMRNGLAYHFVIGNGTSSGNGQIEIGDRWRRQINGGHVHSDYLNNIALGICLVGDFNRDQPTRAQLDACEELIRYLRLRCGKIDAHFAIVRPHREVNPPRWATDCPGDAFPYSWFRRFQE